MKTLFASLFGLSLACLSPTHAGSEWDGTPRQKLGEPRYLSAGYVVNGLPVAPMSDPHRRYPMPRFQVTTHTETQDGSSLTRDSLTVELLLEVDGCYSQKVKPDDFLVTAPKFGAVNQPARFAFRRNANQTCIGLEPFQATLNVATLSPHRTELSREETDPEQCAPRSDCLIRRVVSENLALLEPLGGGTARLRYLETVLVLRKANGKYEVTEKVSDWSFTLSP